MNNRKLLIIFLCAALIVTGAVTVAILTNKPGHTKHTEADETPHPTGTPSVITPTAEPTGETPTPTAEPTGETPTPTPEITGEPEKIALYVLTKKQSDLGTVTYGYDEFGRCVRIASKLDSDRLITIDYSYENGEPVTTVITEKQLTKSLISRSYNSEGTGIREVCINYKGLALRDGLNLPGGEIIYHYRYDIEDNGQRLIMTEYLKSGDPSMITVYKKDPFGHLITSGSWNYLSGGAYGGPDSLLYEKGNPRDSEGRVTEIYSPAGTGSKKTFLNMKVTYLDDGSRIESTYDITGHETDRNIYDSENQRIEFFSYAVEGYASLHGKRSPADESGRYLETTTYYSADGVISSKRFEEHAADGRYLRIWSEDAKGSKYDTVTYRYDEKGRLLKVEDSNGTESETFQYDENGNLIHASRNNTDYVYEWIEFSKGPNNERTAFFFDEDLLK
ncbi:MAG: RHS repeat protein [Lachnospiraceae bacterium]|nr:RHS repeat protein [Lachnospiraceae bacterium]